MRILFVLPAMARGGAEIQAKQMAIELVRRGHQVGMVVLLPIQEFESELRENGVEPWSLGMRQSMPSASAAAKFVWLMHRWKPDVVQCWMYAANLLGSLGRVVGRPPVAWAIRSSHIDPSRRSSQRLMRVGALASAWLPDRIFVNSSAGQAFHASMGYDEARMLMIPNGFDIEHYRPDARAGREVRVELGIPADAPVVGIVARFDPDKDHATFFRAAGLLRQKLPDVRFLIVGRGLAENPFVEKWMVDGATKDACVFTGQRADTARLNNAMDVATLSSEREGFPNALGEAMACGVPCVATAAGDSAELIGDTGTCVPVRDAAALAQGWERLLRLSPEARRATGEIARARIVERFAMDAIVSRYEREWGMLRAAS